jgi:protein TonB
MRPADNSFPGRTVEASDSGVMRTPAIAPAASTAPAQAITQSSTPSENGPAGSAVVTPLPSAPAPTKAVPAATDVVPAKLVKRVAPVAPANTPPRARGQVVVQFEIGLNGKVSDIEVMESDPRGVFDDAVRDAVRKWVYEPRRENGVAVISKGQARLVFEAAR